VDLELVNQLRRELREQQSEIDDLRAQLRSIHTSDGWAVLRTLAQAREALAPHGTRRDRLARLGIRALRMLKKGFTRATRSKVWLIGPHVSRPESFSSSRGPSYSVICLPMIEWDFRFQRPQQLMRQFARQGHLVLYAANHFHRGGRPRMRRIENHILEVSLPGDPAANIYQMLPSNDDVARMSAAFASLDSELGLSDCVVVVQHPYWTALSVALHERFEWPVVYDCMDDHAGFLHNGSETLQTERRLVASADLVVASSSRLLEHVRRTARTAILLRNACDYEHFCNIGSDVSRRSETPRIGYYGAIAEWFDTRLVAELARLRPDWRFELIGSTLAGDVRPFHDSPNIRLLGERPYAALPGLVAGWDAFIIPFKRLALTEATNPVKVYEMLATGKPVVAVGLPELIPIAREGLIRLADTAAEFETALAAELQDEDVATIDARRVFAARNTWHGRYLELEAAIREIRQSREALRGGSASLPSDMSRVP
jgi:glycosyltransferase involved in cell wall biosynthesis